jgi:hypothetical protein
MGTILDNLKNVNKAMKTEGIRETLGLALQQAAIAAMMDGIRTGGAWEKYMSLFADNAEQLTLLTVSTDGEPDYVRTSRAYMVANSICGADSTTQTSLRVNPNIDLGLNAAVDGNIANPGEDPAAGVTVRPFLIPKV